MMERQERLSDGSLRKYRVYIFEEYARLMKTLEPPSEEMLTVMDAEERQRTEAKIKKKKQALFGPDINIVSPDRYQEVGMVRELGLLPVWHSLSIDWKADIIAEYRLKQMADVVHRWYEDEQREKDAKKAKKGNTNGAAQ